MPSVQPVALPVNAPLVTFSAPRVAVLLIPRSMVWLLVVSTVSTSVVDVVTRFTLKAAVESVVFCNRTVPPSAMVATAVPLSLKTAMLPVLVLLLTVRASPLVPPVMVVLPVLLIDRRVFGPPAPVTMFRSLASSVPSTAVAPKLLPPWMKAAPVPVVRQVVNWLLLLRHRKVEVLTVPASEEGMTMPPLPDCRVVVLVPMVEPISKVVAELAVALLPM